jgi:hypothetical protein
MGQKASTILNCCWRRTLHIGNMRCCPLEACNLDTGKPLLARQRLGDWPTDCWQCLNQNGYGIYIYIYTRFAYGTLRCLRSRTKHSSKQGTVRSRAISKGISKEKHAWSKVLSEGKRSMLEQCFQRLSGRKARSSNAFECSVASKEKEACSSIDLERSEAFRRYKKHARAVISSAQRPNNKIGQ